MTDRKRLTPASSRKLHGDLATGSIATARSPIVVRASATMGIVADVAAIRTQGDR